jgi:hypothetical protein
MPLSTDAVARMCIVDDKKCNLIDKCDECKKEIKKLIEIDEMYADYFAQLAYLKKRSVEKMD